MPSQDAHATLDITIDSQTALSLQAAPTAFRVTILRLAARADTLAVRPLTLSGAHLVGEIGPLPAWQTYRFVVEAEDVQTGTVMYRATADAYVRGNRRTLLALDLHPVVPLIKFTPRYAITDSDSTFAVEVGVFRVPNLYGISFRVHWPLTEPLAVDSVVRHPDLPARVIFFAQPGAGAPNFYTFSVSETDTAQVLTDLHGDQPMTLIYFRRSIVPTAGETFTLWLEVTSGVVNVGGQRIDILPSDIFTDECVVAGFPSLL